MAAPDVKAAKPTAATTCDAGVCDDEAESETEVNGEWLRYEIPTASPACCSPHPDAVADWWCCLDPLLLLLFTR